MSLSLGYVVVPSFRWSSAPELLVEQIIDAFRARFQVRLEKVVTREERIAFNVPRELRETGAP